MKSKNTFSMAVKLKIGENSKRNVTTALKHYHREKKQRKLFSILPITSHHITSDNAELP